MSTPVTIQGITGDRVRVTQEGTIQHVGIKGYYSPNMTANIISYNKLKETHNIQYDEARDIFTATSHTGPTLTFACVNGHYIMDIHAVRQAYVASLSSKAERYSRSSSMQLELPMSSCREWDTSVIKQPQRLCKEVV